MGTTPEHRSWLCQAVLKIPNLPSLLSATALVLGCSQDPNVPTPNTDRGELPAGISENVIAELRRGNHTLTFLDADGVVTIVEDAPAPSRSVVDELAKFDATPLEVFNAFAADTRAPVVVAPVVVAPVVVAPVGLIKDHAMRRELIGGSSERLPPGVRELLLSSTGSPSEGFFAYTSSPENCFFAEDGAFFDKHINQIFAMDWSWYSYSTPASNIIERSDTTPGTLILYAQSCHLQGFGSDFDPTNIYTFGVHRVKSSPECSEETVFFHDVRLNRRVTVWMDVRGVAPRCKYFAYAVNSIQNITHSLGIVAHWNF